MEGRVLTGGRARGLQTKSTADVMQAVQSEFSRNIYFKRWDAKVQRE